MVLFRLNIQTTFSYSEEIMSVQQSTEYMAFLKNVIVAINLFVYGKLFKMFSILCLCKFPLFTIHATKEEVATTLYSAYVPYTRLHYCLAEYNCQLSFLTLCDFPLSWLFIEILLMHRLYTH